MATPTPLTRAQVDSVIRVVAVVADVIRELGPVPSGELYARLMTFLSFADYTALLEMLQQAQLIHVSNHRITWIGPDPGASV